MEQERIGAIGVNRRLHQLKIAGENLLVPKVCGFDQPYHVVQSASGNK